MTQIPVSHCTCHLDDTGPFCNRDTVLGFPRIVRVPVVLGGKIRKYFLYIGLRKSVSLGATVEPCDRGVPVHRKDANASWGETTMKNPQKLSSVALYTPILWL